MADIFGRTEVLPSWLRDDGSRAMQGFQVGLQAAGAIQQNKQRAIENQRADRRMTIEQDQAETRKMLTQSQLEGQRLKVDEEKAFAQDTPAILEFGQAALRATTADEINQLASGIKLNSFAGQQALEKVKSVHEGRIAKKRLESFGTQFDSAVQSFTMANGRPPTEDERRVISSETFMRVDPEQWSKSVLPRQIMADASMANTQFKVENKPPQRPSLDINPLSRAVDRYNEERKDPEATAEDIKLRQQLLASFARQRGEQVSFDESGNPSIVQGVSPALRTKLESGINASKTALHFLDKLTPKKLDEAFGAGAAMRDIGQALGGANVGMGRTEAMTDVFQTLEAIKPLIRSAIQDEKGATTEGDVARASALIGGDFKRNSKQQAKQMVSGLREIFQQAMDRQSGAIAKAPSVQKADADSGTAVPVEKVEVIAPNGQRYMMPAAKLQEALKRGYRRP